MNIEGELEKRFACGGGEGQAKKLISEGVRVHNSQINLSEYYWQTPRRFT